MKKCVYWGVSARFGTEIIEVNMQKAKLSANCNARLQHKCIYKKGILWRPDVVYQFKQIRGSIRIRLLCFSQSADPECTRRKKLLFGLKQEFPTRNFQFWSCQAKAPQWENWDQSLQSPFHGIHWHTKPKMGNQTFSNPFKENVVILPHSFLMWFIWEVTFTPRLDQ